MVVPRDRGARPAPLVDGGGADERHASRYPRSPGSTSWSARSSPRSSSASTTNGSSSSPSPRSWSTATSRRPSSTSTACEAPTADEDVLGRAGEHRVRLQAAIGRQARLRRTPTCEFRPDGVARGAQRIEASSATSTTAIDGADAGHGAVGAARRRQGRPAGRPRRRRQAARRCSAPARSGTPARSTPTPPACCSSASARSPACCASSRRPARPTTPRSSSAWRPRPSTPPARSPPPTTWRASPPSEVHAAAATLRRRHRAGAADGVGRQGRRPPAARAGPRGPGGRAGRPAGAGRSVRPRPTDDPLVWRATVECSSGTYVRTLAADLGTALGGGAHLRSLRRTRGRVLRPRRGRARSSAVRSSACSPRPRRCATSTPSVDGEVAAAVGHGKVLPAERLGVTGDGPWRVLGPDGGCSPSTSATTATTSNRPSSWPPVAYP